MKEEEQFPKFNPEFPPNIVLGHMAPEWAYKAEPLGVILLKGQIKEKQENMPVTIFDSQLENGREDMIERLLVEKPAILGISLAPGGKREAAEIVDKLLPQLLPQNKPVLIFGNVGATFASEEILNEYPQSLVVRGEGEQAFNGILDFFYGRRELDTIPNLIYKHDGKIVQNPQEVSDLDKLALPFREESKKYIKAGIQNVAETSRGCKFYCTFCNRHSFFANTRAWRSFPIDYVIKDLEALSSIGSTGLTFADEDFFQGGLERVANIAKRIIESKTMDRINPDFQISTALRVDDVYSEKDSSQDNSLRKKVLLLLKQAGLVWVFMGVESGSPGQLKRFGKGISIEETRRAVSILEKLGIGIEAGFIMFDPLMNFVELRENITFLKHSGLYKYVVYPFSTLRVEPGSAALTLVENSDLITGEFDSDWLKFPYAFNDERIAELVKICHDWRVKTDDFIRMLKRHYREKIFIGGAKTLEARQLFYYTGLSKLQFIKLLESIADSIELSRGQGALEEILATFDKEIGAIVDKVLRDVKKGIIVDRDGELARAGEEFLRKLS